MTSYDYIRFHPFKLVSGRWVKLDMGTQWLRPTPAPPYQGTPVDMEVNPWARGGLPQPEDSCAPDEGSFGLDSAEIVFHNVPIKPSVDDTTLEELLSSVKPEQQCWNIRMWSTTTTTLVLGVETPVFATKPDFWGIVESSEISGDLHTHDKTWNTYKIAAKNPLSLLERVSPDTWLNGTAHVGGSYLPHTYDINPAAGVWIDGYKLAELCYADTDGGTRNVWKLYTTDDHNPGPDGIRMVRLVDVLYTIGTAIGLSRPVNDSTGASSNGSVPSTWEYIDINLLASGHPETSWDFDDIVLWRSLYRYVNIFNPLVHDVKWTFWDNEKLAPVSVMNFPDMLAVLKKFLFAHGLTARVSVNASGQQYLEVREVELASIAAAPSGDILRGISLDEGEAAAFGFSVVTANNGELSEGAGDKSIDQPYMGATRLREGARWNVALARYDTDDMECLYASLYVYDAATNKAKSVYKIIPKRDGVARATASPFMPGAPGDPGVAPDTGSLPAGSSFETRAHEAGSVVAKAAISYYWNGEADPETDPVGIYRRYTKKLTWKETGIKDVIVGSMRTILGKNWTVRRVKRNYSEDWTEVEAERGTYDA